MTNTPLRSIALLLALTAASALAQARAPYLSISGDLRDSVGNPVNSATDLVVRLYDSSAAPVSSALHVENFPATNVSRGQFQLQLGTSVALQQTLFTRPVGAELWVGVQVAGEGEMSPRLRITSAPWALSADWSGLTSVPATFPPSAHQHMGSDISSAVANADSVPWTGVTGRPTTVVTSVTAGPGLTGGTITSTGTIGLAPTVQSWATQPSCPAGQFLRAVTAAGVPTCAADANAGGTVTSVATGAGLTGGPITATGTIGLAATVQNWATQPTCPVGQYLRAVTAAGVPTCAADSNSGGTVTSVTASAPLVSSGGAAPNLTLGTVGIANGGTGSTTQNFVDLTTNQTIGGSKNFTRVGIGVAAPVNELEIASTTPAAVLNGTAAGYSSLYFQESGTLLGVVQQIGSGWPVTPSRQNTLEVESMTGDVALRTASVDRLRVDNAGNVSIGVTTPTAALHVGRDLAGANGVAKFENTNAGAAQGSTGIVVTAEGRTLELDLAGSASTLAPFAQHIGYAVVNTNGTAGLDLTATNPAGVIRFFPAGLATERMRITTTGQVGIGTAAPAATLDVQAATPGLRVGGTCVSGTCPSDRRLKTDISYLGGALSLVQQLKPASYRYRSDPAQVLGYGLIAQDVEQVRPDWVETNAQGLKSVHYEQLPFLALESIKELKQQADERDAKVQALEKENRELRARLEAIERRLEIGGKRAR